MLRKGIIIGDRYEIIEQIGTGGMSDVYKAKCHKLNRFVAVKVLKNEFREDKNFVSKFRVEAQSAAGLSHPNIVNVYDVGNENGLEYIVMELIEGITLKTYIEKKGHLAIKEATSIAIQVAQGIEAAHKNHIIHRDIKPQNIVISKEGKVKVTDFGIARAASANTINSNAIGSVHYISPEQARGGFVDEKSDIYSLGVVLFEMITGKVPFEGDSTVGIALRHIQDEMPKLTDVIPDVPISVSRIIEKCTQKKPDGRYLKVSSLIADLKKSLVMPNEDFVQIIPAENAAATVMITDDEVSVIKNDSNLDIRNKIKGITEVIDMPDFSDEDLDDEIKDDNPKMDKMIKIGAIVSGAVIILIIALLLFNFLGGFSSCTNGNNISDLNSEYVEMIDVVGKDEVLAQEELEELGLKVSFEYEESNDIDAGLVISQSEDEGDKVKIGSRVTLVVSTGSEKIEVPDLTGETKEKAIERLTELGLKYITEEEFNDDFELDEIIRTLPIAGEQVDYGDKVTLFVSRGSDDMTIVPDLIGDPESGLEAQLTNFDLNVVYQDVYKKDGYTSTDNETVIAQSLASDATVEKGETITVTVAVFHATRSITTLTIQESDLSAVPADGDEMIFTVKFYDSSDILVNPSSTTSNVGNFSSPWSASATMNVDSAAKYYIVEKVTAAGSTVYTSTTKITVN